MSDQPDTPSVRRPSAPEIIEIAKAVARGLAREDYELEQRERAEQEALKRVDSPR